MEKEFDIEEVDAEEEIVSPEEEEIEWGEFADMANMMSPPEDEIAVSFIHRRLTGRSSNYMHHVPYKLRLRAGAVG